MYSELSKTEKDKPGAFRKFRLGQERRLRSSRADDEKVPAQVYFALKKTGLFRAQWVATY